MSEKTEFVSFADIFQKKQSSEDKKKRMAPAYIWQDLALRIIKDLNIPPFKKSSVFKICRDKDPQVVERALNDTKELCKNGDSWKYFFKVIDLSNKDNPIENKLNKQKIYGQNIKSNYLPQRNTPRTFQGGAPERYQEDGDEGAFGGHGANDD